MDAPIDWLLEGEPFVEYRTRLDLLGQSPTDPAVVRVRDAALDDPRFVRLVDDLKGWPGAVVASHKSAGQPFHKLTFVADVGLTVDDPNGQAIASAILAHQSDEGPFQLPMNIPAHYGGTGEDTWAWALCDAPLSVYALARMGLADDPRVLKAVDHLRGLVRENGWPCAVSRELGSFRGPGRKDDPCPFATLAMLKALAEFEGLRDGPECRAGAESLLALWADSRSRHPYQFYMGTDFRKLKAPFVWYDLLHVLDVLSRFTRLTGDSARPGDLRLLDMLGVLAGKMDAQGRFTAESAWTWWKDWEFAQKRDPSRWATLLAWRILRRGPAVLH